MDTGVERNMSSSNMLLFPLQHVSGLAISEMKGGKHTQSSHEQPPEIPCLLFHEEERMVAGDDAEEDSSDDG